MHRAIEITVPAASTDQLLMELKQLEHVVGLSVRRGSSIKPPGDVITVHTLNRGADEVLKRVFAAQRNGAISVVTAEVASIIDPDQRELVDRDVDEAIWEEMETGLRHQGRVTTNFLLLMALGGAIAAGGLVSEGTAQTTALVAASIIAPAYEPLAKLPLGLVLRRWNVVGRGLLSVSIGYTVLILAAALTLLTFRLLDTVSAEEFVKNAEVERLAHPTLIDTLVSVFAAVAGMTMIAAYRRSVIAGPLMALAVVPAAAMIGAALAVGDVALAYEGLKRFALDTVLIVGLGALVVLLKQWTVHHRQPMV